VFAQDDQSMHQRSGELIAEECMNCRQPRYPREEHARRGREMYEQRIRPQVEAGNQGRIVAVDIDSGEFEIADTTLAASERLLARIPDAQIWCVRIGFPAVHRFGPLVSVTNS
jgi:hypothetical protein